MIQLLAHLMRDLLPVKVRLWLYLLVVLAAIVIAAWTAAEGDWGLFIAALVTAFQGALAAGNINLAVVDADVGPIPTLEPDDDYDDSIPVN